MFVNDVVFDPPCIKGGEQNRRIAIFFKKVRKVVLITKPGDLVGDL